MPDITTNPEPDSNRASRRHLGRLGWFVVLYCASLGVWLLFAYGLRSLLVPGAG
jgi:cell division septal protein FtsQ